MLSYPTNIISCRAGENPEYVQWAGERHTKYTSYSYSDIDNTLIRSSNSITTNDDDDGYNNDYEVYKDLICYYIGINNIGNEYKHKLHYHHYYYFKPLRSNYIYGDDLVANFKSDFKSNFKFDINYLTCLNLCAGCGNTTRGSSNRRNCGRSSWCHSYRSRGYRVSKVLAPQEVP